MPNQAHSPDLFSSAKIQETFLLSRKLHPPMALFILGIGLYDERDITLRGLDIIRECSKVYLEHYTSRISCGIERLEALYGKKIIVAGRELVENSNELLSAAKNEDVAFLVMGDALSATTHIELMLEAKTQGILVHLVHNASILTAVAITGLQLYKFGRVGSIPFSEGNWLPETHYDVLRENISSGLHTLLLFDLRPDSGRFMTVCEAIDALLEIESRRKEKIFTGETMCVGCARLGSDSPVIRYGPAGKVAAYDFGDAPHCLVIPGRLHFKEEEALKTYQF